MDEERNSITQTQTIVTLSKLVTAKAMQQCLMFIYTGTIDKEYLELQVSQLSIIVNADNLISPEKKNYYNFLKSQHH